MASEERRNLLILGAGKFAVEVADLVSDTGAFDIAGFVQSVSPDERNGRLEGLPVYWVEDMAAFAGTHEVICAIGSPARRNLIERAARMGMQFATLIHPAANVSRQSSVGKGGLVFPGAVVGAKTTIGKHVIVNRGCLIGHHTELGDYTILGPGVNVAGSVRIGDGVLAGMGAVIRDPRGSRTGGRCGYGSHRHPERTGGQNVSSPPVRKFR